MKTFKALSALLSYPSADLKEAAWVIGSILHEEKVLSPAQVQALNPLLTDLAKLDLYELQERYVLLFDRSRTLSLNLFEHVHGESRDRGPAMVDLLETYRAGGYDLAATELPDHLPVLLEFLSTQPLDQAKEIVADAGYIIAALAERLTRRESNYAPVMDVLAKLGGVALDAEPVQELLSVADDNPEDLEALDAVWEEAEVTFGPNPDAGCPATRDMLARMDPVQNAQSAAATQN